MDKLKKLIKILIILAILCIFVLTVIIFNIKQNQEKEEQEIKDLDGDTLPYDENTNLLVTKQEYININTCLQTYVSELNQNKSSYYGYNSENKYTQIVENSVIDNNIYHLLSEEYIRTNAITVANVKNYVYQIKENCFYIPTNIDKRAEYTNMDIFAIEGLIETTDYKPLYESYLFLSIDKINNTFSVQQVKNKQELLNYQFTKLSEIKNNGNNIYNIKGNIEDELAKNYILQYKRLVLGYPELVYNNYLEDEYKAKRFGTLERFKTYIKENENDIKRTTYNKYQVNKQDGYTQYILVDQNEKYYIFNTSNIFAYKVLLDTYTINTPQFIEKYQAANIMEKVGYNIQKCLDSINDKNYSYMYSKLDEEFKNTKYKTENDFKEEMQNKLFDKNIVSDVNTSNEGEICIYKITVSDSKDTSKKVDMTIIMKLEEEYNFVMSFSFE